jgi:hypothetical protein
VDCLKIQGHEIGNGVRRTHSPLGLSSWGFVKFPLTRNETKVSVIEEKRSTRRDIKRGKRQSISSKKDRNT